MGEDRKFFELLKNEGMEGILKEYTPIENLVDKLGEEIAKKDKIIRAMAKELANTVKNRANMCIKLQEDPQYWIDIFTLKVG